MPLFKDENALVSFLKTRLEERHFKVYARVNLASRKFDEFWSEWYGYLFHPPQPDIDLFIVDEPDKLYAIEVKYFKKPGGSGKRRVNYSFYKGIDESLALLRYGFQGISLWHFFDPELSQWIIHQYQSSTRNLVIKLKLPIQYNEFYIEEYEGEIQAYPIHEGAPFIYEYQPGKRAIPILPSMSTVSNPLRETEEAKKMMGIMKVALRIPTKV